MSAWQCSRTLMHSNSLCNIICSKCGRQNLVLPYHDSQSRRGCLLFAELAFNLRTNTANTDNMVGHIHCSCVTSPHLIIPNAPKRHMADPISSTVRVALFDGARRTVGSFVVVADYATSELSRQIKMSASVTLTKGGGL